MLKNNIEILAPAGNAECLKAALYTGADAVYLGLEDFSARKNAGNFTIKELPGVVNLCHSFGAKAYLTLNTLVFDDEITKLKEYLSLISESGINAIIIQDIGVFSLLKKMKSKIPLHASTQMSVTSANGAEALRKLGFKRVVLARELSFDEITEITDKVDIETEVFVHGALCVCLSGQCYMSAVFGGRSGNRGLCAQPCRLEFSNADREHVLSLKDLSLLNHIQDLSKAGVASIKIEGRMKRPEYVASVTDACYEIRKSGVLNLEKMAGIKSVFSRSGFTEGYYNSDFNDMSGIRTKEDVVSVNPTLLDELKTLYAKPVKKYILNMYVEIKADKNVLCKASYEKGKTELSCSPAEKATGIGLKSEQVIAQLSKLGGTPFEAGDIQCVIDNGLWLSVSQINEIRRNVLEALLKI